MSDRTRKPENGAGTPEEWQELEATVEVGDGMDPPPSEIEELAVACCQYVHGALGIELDFTAETLPVLDHYIDSHREELEGRPDLLPLLARAVGAYFGEVLRQHIGGFWLLPSPNIHDWAFCGRRVFLAINPIGVAYDALTGGTEHDGPNSRMRLAPDEREGVIQRLSDIEVDEEEYYLLSTRLEGIEIAADSLQAQMVKKGYEDVEFDQNDYLNEVRPVE